MAIKGYRNKSITGGIADAGMSSASPPEKFRMMNSDGSLRIENVGYSSTTISDIYLALVRMSWARFFFFFGLFLLLINLLFTTLYFVVGETYILGLPGNTFEQQFLKVFLFSVQSLTTSGFGFSSVAARITIIAAIEALTGLLTFAVATGLLYGRLSQPSARLLHSKNALISPYLNGRPLMFRIVNARRYHMVNVEWNVQLALSQQIGDKTLRRYHNVKLENNKALFFPLSWTIVHPIDENSPLLNLTKEDFEDGSLEIFIMVDGFDETFNQTVHTRFGYHYPDIVWGAKFNLDFETMPDGHIRHYPNKISEYHPAALP